MFGVRVSVELAYLSINSLILLRNFKRVSAILVMYLSTVNCFIEVIAYIIINII